MPMYHDDEKYLRRCYDLAKLSGNLARPNPSVGAIIVHQGIIIGEGYTQKYGSAHAEVQAVSSVLPDDRHLISQSTLYVSLEPCHHYGKTPPCVDLVLRERIPTVVIGIADPNKKVNSKSISKLKDNGVSVRLSSFPQNAQDSIADFYAIKILARPYIQLKWAKSADNYIGTEAHQVHLSGPATNMYTHKLRGLTDAILIGTNTAMIDDPSLTQRHYAGSSPIRIILDRTGRLPKSLSVYSDDHQTITITDVTTNKTTIQKDVIALNFQSDTFITDLLQALREIDIHHLMVEGGASVLKSFIKDGPWDEAVIITASGNLESGIKAPHAEGRLHKEMTIDKDRVQTIKKIINNDVRTSSH